MMKSDLSGQATEAVVLMDATNRRVHGYSVLIIFLVTLTIYANGCRGPFLFDDLYNIAHNTDLQLETLDGPSLCRAAFRGPSVNRPVAKLTFALNYYFHKHDVFGYHIVNVVVHAVNGCLVYWLTLLVLGQSRLGSDVECRSVYEMHFIAAAVGLVFVVHPLQSQAVTYIVQRMASLAAMFYLLALITYIRGRQAPEPLRKWWWFAAMICWIFALGTKENTIMIPVAIGAYEWCFGQRIARPLACRGWMLPVISFLLVLGMAGIYLGSVHPIQELLNRYEYRDFGMWQRVLTQFRVVVFYLTLVVFPWPERLNLIHWISTSAGVFNPCTTILALVVLLFLVGMALAYARRQPVVAFGLLFVLIHLIVESTIVNLEMVFEHRMYLPMAGVAILMAGIAVNWAPPRRLIVLAALPVILVCGYWTMERNMVWSDTVRFWTDVIRKNAHHARPVYNRGHAFQRLGKFSEAERDYLEAVRREPYLEAFTNLGNMYAKLGRYDDSIGIIDQAITLKPRAAVLYNNRASVYLRCGQFQSSLEDLNRALAISPDYAMAYYNRGRLLAKQGQDEEAVAEYSLAIEKDSHLLEAFVNRGNTFFRQKKFQKALTDYDRAVALRPDLPTFVYYRGLCRMRLGDYLGALQEFERTLQLDNQYVDAYDHLAWIMATCPKSRFRDGQRAVRYAQTACKISGRTNYRYLMTLAAAYAEQGQFDAAVHEQRLAIELAPPDERPLLRESLSQYRHRKAYRNSETLQKP